MNIDEKRFEFFKESNSGFSILTTALHKSFIPLKNLPPRDSFGVNDGGSPLSTFEVGVRLRFAYLEKFLENNFFRTSLGSPYPITEINLSHGFSGVFKSIYYY